MISSRKCEICDESIQLSKLPSCDHELCMSCFEKISKINPKCPFCNVFFGKPKGNQPKSGKMLINILNSSLPGYQNTNTIEITYKFPSGIQNADHPNPNKKYDALTRNAYLPDNFEGQNILKLFKRAFECGLMFTIGQSISTGLEGLVWNDIHHKTELISGSL